MSTIPDATICMMSCVFGAIFQIQRILYGMLQNPDCVVCSTVHCYRNGIILKTVNVKTKIITCDICDKV